METISIPVWIFEGLGVFLITQLGLSIWWAATITANLKNISDKVDELSKSGFATQSYVDKEFGKLQKEIDAAHHRIDEQMKK